MGKDNIKIFENGEFGQVRIVELNNEVWFVGKDVAGALGYLDTNKAINMHVDVEDKLNDKTALSLGQRGGWLINESGLYSLILSSKLESAKKFKKWVTGEVLPSIRSNGAYMTEGTVEKVLNDPDFMIKLLENLKSERKKVKVEQYKNKMLELEIKENEHKVEFVDNISVSEDCVEIGVLAKILSNKFTGKDKIGRNWLFRWLGELGYITKVNGFNVPYQRWVDYGLFKVKEYVYGNEGFEKIGYTTVVTVKGQIYFAKRSSMILDYICDMKKRDI